MSKSSLLLLLLESTTAQTRDCLVSYACHPPTCVLEYAWPEAKKLPDVVMGLMSAWRSVTPKHTH